MEASRVFNLFMKPVFPPCVSVHLPPPPMRRGAGGNPNSRLAPLSLESSARPTFYLDACAHLRKRNPTFAGTVITFIRILTILEFKSPHRRRGSLKRRLSLRTSYIAGKQISHLDSLGKRGRGKGENAETTGRRQNREREEKADCCLGRAKSIVSFRAAADN